MKSILGEAQAGVDLGGTDVREASLELNLYDCMKFQGEAFLLWRSARVLLNS